MGCFEVLVCREHPALGFMGAKVPNGVLLPGNRLKTLPIGRTRERNGFLTH